MNNPTLQKSALTPDLYAFGKLKDGRRFEIVGDVKMRVIVMRYNYIHIIIVLLMVPLLIYCLQMSGRMQQYLQVVAKYVTFLSTNGTTVSGSFDADRVPAPVIIGVLGTYVHDQEAVDEAEKAGVVLLSPSGKVLQASSIPTGVTLKSGINTIKQDQLGDYEEGV